MKRLFVGALVVFGVACEEPVTPPPPPVLDGGGRDARVPLDDSGVDAREMDTGIDAAFEDGGIDAGRDASRPDAGPPPIPAEQTVCGPAEPTPTCDTCDTGTICVDEFCAGQECVPGRPCEANDDCGSSNCIVPVGARSGFCQPTAGCTSEAECAAGFACETGNCVDRRIPCGYRTSACPRGMVCGSNTGTSRPVCVWGQPACERDAQCGRGARCVDVDGENGMECVPGGLCTTNEDCEANTSCGVNPQTSQASCVVDGPCRAGECPDGFSCTDVGQGPRCVVTGTCDQNSDCGPQSVCGAILPRDPLRCLTFDEDAK